MLTFLFVFALVRALKGTLTFEPGDIPALAVESHVFSPQAITFGTRTTSSIILSSFATIFACTWTAIHPNIPGPTDSGWAIFKRRVVTMLYALLAPECIVWWALNQNFAAKHIMEDYNKEFSAEAVKKPFWRAAVDWFRTPALPLKLEDGQVRSWTAAHGFFLLMGGFVLCDKGQPVQVLDYEHLISWIKEKEIDAPMTTEAEIKDRSKGDTISKTVVILQTTWFIAQCIARWSVKLPVTELEQVTLGFALLNGITYGIWWNKPQNVGVPVYLEWKRKSVSSEDSISKEESTEAKHLPPKRFLPRNAVKDPGEIRPTPPKRSYLVRKLVEDRQHFSGWLYWTLIWIFDVAWRLIMTVLHPLFKMIDAEYPLDEGAFRVPMFYSGVAAKFDEGIILNTSCIFGVLFGLVHLIPSWLPHFPSPSPIEMLVWRACAIVVTAEPMMVVALVLVSDINNISDILVVFLSAPAFIGLPLYIVARLGLIGLALSSLRHLPDNAHQTIDWVASIPHF